MSTGTGVNVSKSNVYALLSPPAGVNVSKSSVYALLSPPVGINVSKSVVYVLLNGSPVAPSWPSFSFGNGVVGSAYAQTFGANGTAPITYTLLSGSLPAGLTLNSAGSISGTPTSAGTSSFTLRATNAFGTADLATAITVLTPGGGSGTSAVGYLC